MARDVAGNPHSGLSDLVLAWISVVLIPSGFLVLLATGGEYDPAGASRHDVVSGLDWIVTVAATASAVAFGRRAGAQGRDGGPSAALLGIVLGAVLIPMLTIIIVADLAGWS